MTFVINPGTEPLYGTSEANAAEAVRMFVEDFGEALPAVTRNRAADGGGRYGFTLWFGDIEVEIDMPGCDPNLTRRGEPWVSPRLYVDGSSWLWGFGLNAVSDRLETEEGQ